jgi:hypothetical protein
MAGQAIQLTPPKTDDPVGVYWAFAWWTIALGIVLMLAPGNWFGPSWHFFKQFPQDGFWMGLCCTMLGTWQLLVMWRSKLHDTTPSRLLALLFFFSGFVFWTSGLTLAIAGLVGHQGLMEAPFMLYVGAHKFAYSADLMARRHVDDVL